MKAFLKFPLPVLFWLAKRSARGKKEKDQDMTMYMLLSGRAAACYERRYDQSTNKHLRKSRQLTRLAFHPLIAFIGLFHSLHRFSGVPTCSFDLFHHLLFPFYYFIYMHACIDRRTTCRQRLGEAKSKRAREQKERQGIIIYFFIEIEIGIGCVGKKNREHAWAFITPLIYLYQSFFFFFFFF
ncbi:hypothetical protein HDK77DRAFT_447205, partial [Phyllosticta capitalensis]